MLTSTLLVGALAVTGTHARPKTRSPPVNSITCNGNPYTYTSLAGYGVVPGDDRDKFGDTLGGIGSAIAFEKGSWRKRGSSYEGILWALPDRGWNADGTLNYQNRVHKFGVTFKPNEKATVEKPGSANLELKYIDSVGFIGPDGNPVTGLDADASGSLILEGFPEFPPATYPGDGFGDPGPGGKRISVDSEGLVLGRDDSFYVSDEYGPYIYQLDSRGKMVSAIRPPDAFIPLRNETQSFNSDTPPRYDPDRQIVPEDPEVGRNNNQGFEGLASNPDGTRLYVLLQSALQQDGGAGGSSSRRYTRLLIYDISGMTPEYTAEYVVPLPTFQGTDDGEQIQLVAAQSELQYVTDTQFLILSRDGGRGRGQDETESLYRQVDVFDISAATNVKGADADSTGGSIASEEGVLKAGIVPATYCSFLNINDNKQLGRFGLRNGGPDDPALLNEKWEGLAIVPVEPEDEDGDEYFLFVLSDNDFITQNGFMRGGTLPYADSSGANLNNQALVFKVKLPAKGLGAEDD